MKQYLSHAKLLVKKSPIHGYGVFAEQDIPAGGLIEEAYTIPISNESEDLENYYFRVVGENGPLFMPLGHGVIYNHHDHPNADFEYDSDDRIVIFQALRDIKKGEEIFIYYSNTWFESRNLKKKRRIKWRFILRKLFSPMLLRFTITIGSIFLLMAGLKYLTFLISMMPLKFF